MSKFVTLFQCDGCKILIVKPEDGFRIKGNIYTAETSQYMGLIGNNIVSETDNVDKILDVKETVLCKKCFLAALHIDNKVCERVPMK